MTSHPSGRRGTASFGGATSSPAVARPSR
jgi:hypothetical protein